MGIIFRLLFRITGFNQLPRPIQCPIFYQFQTRVYQPQQPRFFSVTKKKLINNQLVEINRTETNHSGRSNNNSEPLE